MVTSALNGSQWDAGPLGKNGPPPLARRQRVRPSSPADGSVTSHRGSVIGVIGVIRVSAGELTPRGGDSGRRGHLFAAFAARRRGGGGAAPSGRADKPARMTVTLPAMTAALV
ncbi:hypothetical protein FJT64_000605 [Amphibalanus amphitrite]|uniref:Uncharacterized protein n=1 Tax=Amphibalanus amphitrite TaxID=1232801 RepID=A0A6A4VPM4_AMPAM|nr:hypothetical protein FJT64_000605 [Amphibalanus amphitrite]